jgi:hypothetical protein
MSPAAETGLDLLLLVWQLEQPARMLVWQLEQPARMLVWQLE